MLLKIHFLKDNFKSEQTSLFGSKISNAYYWAPDFVVASPQIEGYWWQSLGHEVFKCIKNMHSCKVLQNFFKLFFSPDKINFLSADHL